MQEPPDRYRKAHLPDYIDLIAERATTLGGTALGTIRLAAGTSRLSEYPLDAGGNKLHVAALAATTRSAIEAADTADLLTQVSRRLDKSLWFLEDHWQA